MALSDDLRKRVVEAVVEDGLSRNAAAKLFKVSIASSVRWVKQFETTGEISPKPAGGDRRSGRIEAHHGNPRLRTALIQLAWLWVRHQPQSALALWFKERVSRNGGRFKKTTIVALARKLLVALWKYVTAGVVVEGAVMKAA